MTNNQMSIKSDVLDLGLRFAGKEVGNHCTVLRYSGRLISKISYVARMIFAEIFRSTLLLLLLLLLKTSIAGAAVAGGSSAACALCCCRDASDV